jgi:hypothetical protein
MNAKFFKPTHRAASPARQEVPMGKGNARRSHRWIAIVFTLSVALNFAVMPWRQPPAWITYAPLPPLLFLTLTGLVMLVSSWFAKTSHGQRGADR